MYVNECVRQSSVRLSRQAVQSVHNPANLDVAEAARVRLAFDELLFMQLTLLVRRALSRCARHAPSTRNAAASRLLSLRLFFDARESAAAHCHVQRAFFVAFRSKRGVAQGAA